MGWILLRSKRHALIEQSFNDHGYLFGMPYKTGTWGVIYLVTKLNTTDSDSSKTDSDSSKTDSDSPKTDGDSSKTQEIQRVAKIAKIARIHKNPTMDLFLKYEWEKEVYYCQYLYNNYNIGPKFYTAWTTENLRGNESVTQENMDLGIIILEKWHSSLDRRNTFFSLDQQLRDKLKHQIILLHHNHLVHADIVARNVFVKKDENNNIIDITLGDMGSMRTIEAFQKPSNRNELQGFYNYHRKINPDFFDQNKLDFETILRDPRWLDLSFLCP